MEKLKLSDFDSEDLEDVLKIVEDSFGIMFTERELEHVQTFGELCDHIVNKIAVEEAGDCTSQQAFYKLRKVLAEVLEFEKKDIYPETSLSELLPREYRIPAVKEAERKFGFSLGLLHPPKPLVWLLFLSVLGSLIYCFFDWRIGGLWLLLNFICFRIADKMGKELRFKTMRELSEYISRKNYLHSRRNSNSYNKKEIEPMLVDLFSDELGIDKTELGREARIS